MARVLKVGDVGIDYANQPASDAAIAAAGATFKCRYSSGTAFVEGSTAFVSTKCTKKGEIQSTVANNMDFFGNFEKSEGTPTEGAASGKNHGLADKDFWNSRGLAPKAGVIISWEPGSDKSQWNNVAAFIQAYKTAIGRPVGGYMGLPSLIEMRRRGLIDFTWLPMSSAASGINFGNVTQAVYAAKMKQLAIDNGINLCQNRNRWYIVNGIPQADENVYTTAVTKPFSHLQALVPPPSPDWLDTVDLATFRKELTTIVRAELLGMAATVRWGDNWAHLTATQLDFLNHNRDSLGDLDASNTFGKQGGFFVQFPDDPHSDTAKQAIYLCSGGYLVYLTDADWAAINATSPPRLLSTVKLSTTGNIYKLPSPPGVPDPRTV
jgi:hypothetical protein